MIKEKESGNRLYHCSFDLGDATCNEAEYLGLVYGLITTAKIGICNLEVFGDSELVIKQMNKQYTIKATNLMPLYQGAEKLIKLFKQITFHHLSKSKNHEVNDLTNYGIQTSEKSNYKQKISPELIKWKNIFNKLYKIADTFRGQIKPNFQNLASQMEDLYGSDIQRYLSMLEEHAFFLMS